MPVMPKKGKGKKTLTHFQPGLKKHILKQKLENISKNINKICLLQIFRQRGPGDAPYTLSPLFDTSQNSMAN